MKKKLISLICAALLLSSNTANASSVSVTSKGFSASDAPEGSVLIAALYEHDALKALRMVDAAGDISQDFDADFLNQASADDVIKVFLWNKNTLTPVCNAASTVVSDLTDTETTAPTATAAPTETAVPTVTAVPTETAAPTDEPEEEDNTMTITIGEQTFTAVLYDNETAQAFAEMLPMTIDMTAFSGNNEYYYYFDNTFPTDSYRPGTVSAGDLKLYGNECLVIFYETFSTSYSYTDIGYIENPTGLENALKSASGTVTIERSAAK